MKAAIDELGVVGSDGREQAAATRLVAKELLHQPDVAGVGIGHVLVGNLRGLIVGALDQANHDPAVEPLGQDMHVLVPEVLEILFPEDGEEVIPLRPKVPSPVQDLKECGKLLLLQAFQVLG